MAPIYKEISLTWEGTEYTVTPTYQMIQRIEQQISLAGLLQRMSERQPPLSQLADLISMCLREAGCTAASADAESINAELYKPGAAETLATAAYAILVALLPESTPRGNGGAPAKGASTASQTSNGASTTKSPSVTSGSNLQNSGP